MSVFEAKRIKTMKVFSIWIGLTPFYWVFGYFAGVFFKGQIIHSFRFGPFVFQVTLSTKEKL